MSSLQRQKDKLSSKDSKQNNPCEGKEKRELKEGHIPHVLVTMSRLFKGELNLLLSKLPAH